MFDGMASLDSLWELLLDAAGRQSASVRLTGTQAYAHILHGSAFPAESTPVQDMSQLVARLTAGMAVLLLEGCSSGIVFSVQGLKFRSVEEPSAEGNLRGSREGFTDLLRVNLSLLRRLVRTDTLMQEAAQAHTCCNTEYALCYCKDRADPAMVRRVRTICKAHGRSCCWIPAILYRGCCPARRGCLPRCTTPSARRSLPPSSARASW